MARGNQAEPGRLVEDGLMGPIISTPRPAERLLARSAVGRSPVRMERRLAYAPPALGPATAGDRVPPDARDLAPALLASLVLGSPFGGLAARLRPDIVTWSPTAFYASRDELLAATDLPGPLDEVLTEVDLVVTRSDVAGSRLYLTWRLTGRFTRPCFIDDDLLLPPTGALVEFAGLVVAIFDGDDVAALQCFHDELAIIEQLLG